MEDNLRKSLLTICNLLEKYQVQYMLIGGTAVALNGYYRHSINIAGQLTNKPDVDIWYNPTYENYFNILKVIEELGQDITEFKNERSPNPRKSFFKLNFDDFTVDIIPEIKASIKFIEANKRKETVEIDETKIHFINYIDLIRDKEATARKRDLEDIEQLKKLEVKNKSLPLSVVCNCKSSNCFLLSIFTIYNTTCSNIKSDQADLKKLESKHFLKYSP